MEGGGDALQFDDSSASFYEYIMELFADAGHVTTLIPIYTNHSPERFMYFDNGSDFALTRDQQQMFDCFNNVSFLFSANRCSFFSINLVTPKGIRSQMAHSIHSMLHPSVGSSGTICVFHFENEFMFSFIGFGLQCILSDWYRLIDDYQQVVEKLDIANMSIKTGKDYFYDMVFMLARPYYLSLPPSNYDLLPVDYLSSSDYNGMDLEELNNIAAELLSAPQRAYGSDYVEYGTRISATRVDLSAELDMLLLELDDEDDNPFGEEMDSDDSYGPDEYQDETAEDNHDEYEFDDVDPEIFRDPTLMVKWLNKKDEP